MADFDNSYRCTVGGANFQMKGYSLQTDAIVKQDWGRTGTQVTLNGEGWVEGADPVSFAANLTSVRSACLADGQDFTIYGLAGAKELEILAFQCQDGGPHISFGMEEGPAALVKKFTFKLAAVANFNPLSPGELLETFKTEVETTPDGLQRITATGHVIGKNVTAGFLANIISRFKANYPPDQWVMTTLKYDVATADSSLDYTIKVEQLMDAISTFTDSVDAVVDGVYSDRTDRDDKMRKVETVSFDLLLKNVDPSGIIDEIRGARSNTPLSESIEVTGLRQKRLRADLVYLSSGSGDDLLDWEQQIEIEGEDNIAASLSYPGQHPKIYVPEQPAKHATQRGRAVGVGKFPKPPGPIFSALNMAAPRRIARRIINEVEYEVTWEYSFIDSSFNFQGTQWTSSLTRPKTPEFGF